MPSTVKCSSDISPCARSTTRRKKLRAISWLQQSVPILGEHRRGPDRLVHLQAHEPAEQQVVVELLHQQPFAANRVEDLQQLRPEQPLRRDRGAADLRVQPIELAGHLPQHLVDQAADGPERVVGRHTLLGGHVAEHRIGLAVISTHAADGRTGATGCRFRATRPFSASS